MFQPKPMTHLLIAAPKEQMASVVTELYRHRVFHITDFVDQGKEGYEGVRLGTPLEGAGELSTSLLKIRSIENVFQTSPETLFDVPKRPVATIRQAIERELPVIEAEVNDLTVQRSAAESRIRECEQRITELKPFALVPLEMDLYHGYESISVLAGYIAKDVEISVPHEKYYAARKDGNFIVVFAETKDVAEIERILADSGFQSVTIPNETGSVQAAVDKYTADQSQAKVAFDDANAKISELKAKYADLLAACDEVLSGDVERAEAPLRFATTEEAFVIDGWVPADHIEPITAGLNQATGGRVYVTVDDDEIDATAIPVEYNNPSFAKPTELFMDVYARPRYNEIDPTLILAIMFPIFFGLIVGDVGYGILFLILALFARKLAMFKGEGGKNLIKILVGSSISTIFFGLLYSECLGYSLPWHAIIFQRHLAIGADAAAHASGPDAMPLLIVSVWFGIIYITLGRIFGMINHYRMDHAGKHRTKAILGQFGWIAILWGLLVLVWSFFSMEQMFGIVGMMPDLTTAPMIVPGFSVAALAGLILLVVGCILLAQENVLDLMEIPTIISHVLSFCRIAAVGLSSVAIAMVVNYLSFGMFIDPALANLDAVGVIMIIVGVLIFICGHALNVGLGILGGGLHSIRLHYVEFFTKFYVGGGIKYNPFGLKRKFSEE
ncbi:MAG TPA: V-type ATP synthase subunit I [Methanocorpusculum sp.]|nr:V-type ATP synthase subunit I [Methanocorpusculum sp.]HJK74891.1 V-type ATP synthase subunit I [Methanocorpusculum sp.]HJK82785.1 V-type ATP synthase subunit I [Methanocorpusculum sp.]